MATLRTTLTRHGAEVALAATVVLIVAMMIVPLPTWLLDLLLATNLSLALLLLLTALFVRRPLSFAAFPTILLVTTLFRLALNVSSTRLILLRADAGDVIASFGDFVVQGNYIVGAVVFVLLTLIQFVVIARGSERVAEVGARFTLDAMPGKQLAIDADLRAGLLDAESAGARRRELGRESQFYGAMDGAMKFVKGDAIAALTITVVNLLGGLAIGVGTRGMDVAGAVRVYGLLTIGDGLVSQLPALLISTAAGLVVTRVASEDERGTLGGDIGAQIFGDWRALGAAGFFAALLAVVPGLPLVPFAVLALLLSGGAFVLWRRQPAAELVDGQHEAPRAGPLELRVGVRLARSIAGDASFGEHLSRVSSRLYQDLGVRLPSVRPEASDLDPDGYEIRLGAVRVDSGGCPAQHRYRVGSADALRAIDPAVQLDGEGGWSATGEGLGAIEVLVSRLEAAVRARPSELIGLEETRRELDRLSRDAPALVRAVTPERLPLPRLSRLLGALVAEGVSIGALREVLEAASRDPLPEDEHGLVEVIRERLARPITHALVDDDGVLRAHALDPMIEDALRDAMSDEGALALDPDLARDVVAAVRQAVPEGEPAILLTRSDVRAALWRLLTSEVPNLTVLSYQELDPAVRVERLGIVSP